MNEGKKELNDTGLLWDFEQVVFPFISLHFLLCEVTTIFS